MLNIPDAPLASSVKRERGGGGGESPQAHRLHNSSPAFAGLRSARTHTSHRYIIETGRVGKCAVEAASRT